MRILCKGLFFGAMMYLFLSQETCFSFKKKPLFLDFVFATYFLRRLQFALEILFSGMFILLKSLQTKSVFQILEITFRESYTIGIYLIKFINGTIRTMCKICPKLTRKTPERRRRSTISNFKQSVLRKLSKLIFWVIKQ